MKKILSIALVGAITLSMGTIALADTLKSPAKIYGDLTDKTLEEVYDLQGDDKTFGQLAEDEGVLDDFRAANLEAKKQVLAQRVKEGLISEEEADAILKAIEENDCITPGENRVGQKFGVGFGRGNGMGQGQGQRPMDGSGNGGGFGQGRGMGRGFGRNAQ